MSDDMTGPAITAVCLGTKMFCGITGEPPRQALGTSKVLQRDFLK